MYRYVSYLPSMFVIKLCSFCTLSLPTACVMSGNFPMKECVNMKRCDWGKGGGGGQRASGGIGNQSG